MAGDYVQWVKGLERKPEVHGIAKRLGIDRHTVAAKCMLVWAWADDNIDETDIDKDGNAFVTMTALHDLLDVVAECNGFGAAMAQEGWLKDLGNDRAMFPGYGRWNGQTAKSRALTRQRVSRHRSQNVKRSKRYKSVTREEKRREEYKNTPQPPKGEFSERIQEVISHYQTLHPSSRPGEKEKAKIRDRLKEGYTVADLKAAIDGCHKSPHHCGQNERQTKYQSLELIVRDSKHVSDFIEHASGNATFKQRVYDQAIDGPYNPNG